MHLLLSVLFETKNSTSDNDFGQHTIKTSILAARTNEAKHTEYGNDF
jgi:hypothetical protein